MARRVLKRMTKGSVRVQAEGHRSWSQGFVIGVKMWVSVFFAVEYHGTVSVQHLHRAQEVHTIFKQIKLLDRKQFLEIQPAFCCEFVSRQQTMGAT